MKVQRLDVQMATNPISSLQHPSVIKSQLTARTVRQWQQIQSLSWNWDNALQSLHNEYDGVSKSPASRLFTQPFVQTQIKENFEALRHLPL